MTERVSHMRVRDVNILINSFVLRTILFSWRVVALFNTRGAYVVTFALR